MTTKLDLFDIQGNVIKEYIRSGFFWARYVFFHIHDGDAGRKFVTGLVPTITNSAPWKDKAAIPGATTDIAITYEGLKRLGVPELSLHSFPTEFSMGMKARREILGDYGVNGPDRWDRIWRSDESEQPVHLLVCINGRSPDFIETRYRELVALAAKYPDGVKQLSGHRGENSDDLPYQDGSLLFKDGKPIPKEHFGYTDGISEPYYQGCELEPHRVIGGGKPTGGDARTTAGWEPLETGEFLLGHRDEAFEYPQGALPSLLARNGTFLVYRKLHQNVATFNSLLDRVGSGFPGGKEALAAKFVGRWRNGAPLATFPQEDEADRFMKEYYAAQAALSTGTDAAQARYVELWAKLAGFDFTEDISGSRCPLGAHIRRVNPRSSLEFGKRGAFATPGALSDRRRIIRRGLPYGAAKNPASDDGTHGTVIMILNASIARQFEFVQQQWIEYGNDFKLANDKDPLLGNHGDNKAGAAEGRHVIQADPKGDKPPYFCGKIPTFVEMRGGDYFFVPSLTALRMIGDGIVDPT